jgi:hypothetical protein
MGDFKATGFYKDSTQFSNSRRSRSTRIRFLVIFLSLGLFYQNCGKNSGIALRANFNTSSSSTETGSNFDNNSEILGQDGFSNDYVGANNGSSPRDEIIVGPVTLPPNTSTYPSVSTGATQSKLVTSSLWVPYDGKGATPIGSFLSQQGLSCDYFNYSADLKWFNKGGDWFDANGIRQGVNPYVSAVLPILSSPSQYVLDVTAMKGSPGFILRRSGGSVVRIATRESTTPPKLVLELLDGTIQERVAIADAGLNFAEGSTCNVDAAGSSPSLTVAHATVLSFGPIPSDIKSAKLKITVLTSTAKSDLNVFSLAIPRRVYYEAAPYVPNSDPQVLYYEPWEERNWWSRLGSTIMPSAQWTQDGGMFNSPGGLGIWWANGDPVPVKAQGTTDLFYSRGQGYKGKGVSFIFHPTKLAYGTELANVNLKALAQGELEEAWLTYMLKFGKDWHSFANAEGGKVPGLAGPTTHCAGSSVSANGLCGWSSRLSFKMMADPNNPAFPRVPLYNYAYHGLQPGYYGSAWTGNEASLLELDKWYCVEQHLKLNTPGENDGLLQVYVNNTLAIEKKDVYLRALKPELGYGNWLLHSQYPAPPGATTVTDKFGRVLWFKGPSEQTNLGITKVYNVQHGGGVTPPGKSAQMWIDEMKVSLKRAGCPQP